MWYVQYTQCPLSWHCPKWPKWLCPDMENVPSKPSAARVFKKKYQVNFWSEHRRFLSQMVKTLFSMLYQFVRGQLILDWVTFPGYVTLPKLM